MTEPQLRAKSIYNTMGAIDGQVHIVQLLYFTEGLDFVNLLDYWKEVDLEFKKLKDADRFDRTRIA